LDDGLEPIRVLSGERVRADEVSTIYAGDRDRYIVSLIVGYGEDDDVTDPRKAAYHALRLTQDDGSPDTMWRVYDRVTGETFEYTQRELEWA
jgi:hypothetical protein